MRLRLPTRALRWAWPNPSRDALLRAALLPKIDDAQAALKHWLSTHDLDELSFADHRLLAAISERLGPHIKNLPEYPRLKGLQRQLWTQSRIRLNANLPMLKILQGEGIEIMLLKGAARLATDPAAQRERSQQDIDILVRQGDMQRAAQLLSEHGWRTARGDSPLAAIGRASTTRAINFQHPPFGDIDLHRRAYHGNQNNTPCDEALWQTAEYVEFLGLQLRVPCPAERLTMMLAHGARSPEAHSDWLIDAAELIKSNRIDWTQTAYIVRERKMALQAAIGLSYLEHLMQGDFTPEASQFLSSLQVPVTLQNLGNLLVGREARYTPRYLSPLRGLWFAYSRRQKLDAPKSNQAPLVVSLAKQSFTKQDSICLTELATVHLLPLAAPENTGSKSVNFQARVSFAHPGLRRRVEFELNSPTKNLARFRVIVWRRKGKICTAFLRANIALSEEAGPIRLETSLGTRIASESKDRRGAKYKQVNFQLEYS